MVGLTNMSNQWQKTSPVKRQSRAELKKELTYLNERIDGSPHFSHVLQNDTTLARPFVACLTVTHSIFGHHRNRKASTNETMATDSVMHPRIPKSIEFGNVCMGLSPHTKIERCAQMVGLTNMSNQWQKTSPVKRQSRAELKKVNALSSPTGDHRPKTGRSPKGLCKNILKPILPASHPYASVGTRVPTEALASPTHTADPSVTLLSATADTHGRSKCHAIICHSRHTECRSRHTGQIQADPRVTLSSVTADTEGVTADTQERFKQIQVSRYHLSQLAQRMSQPTHRMSQPTHRADPNRSKCHAIICHIQVSRYHLSQPTHRAVCPGMKSLQGHSRLKACMLPTQLNSFCSACLVQTFSFVSTAG
ncbi:hypothetical protein EGW08_005506 [Elysia chlorotica]|uniref:Uncharacterized protein n=1 Tax=Elysia chlorotica TaxID=188477 RepID=A0A3S1BEV4_ELYCH|nr:hypothetical protein EGW08_005506 [Elysia chlorotica]